jgi:UDP-N-acetylglucosamine--N-acetylmuramyl-(pentapeptide) pyrophosphoryl-undecaprenol N-acetylglucosamine transferase
VAVVSGLRWIVAGGGTGGHVTMALALGEAIAARGDHPLFVGHERGFERRLVPEAGFELVTLPAGQLMGRGAAARLAALAQLARGSAAAVGLLRRFGPHALVSVGGYAAAPAVVAAVLLRLPLALVEPNAVPGRTQRAAGRFARRIYLAFEAAAGDFAGAAERVRVPGVPVRHALVQAFAGGAARREPKPPLRLLVVGGSQGARQLNDAMLAALPRLDPAALEVAHQTGEADRARVAAGYQAAGLRADVFAFDADLPARYRWADLALCRSGAITVAELSLARLPSLLVPYPFAADDHQTANARELARAGAARLFDPRAFDGEVLAAALLEVVAQPERLVEMGARAAALARPDAAREIVEDFARLAAPALEGPER